MDEERPKKKMLRWIVLFGLSGVVDVVQILLDLTGAGVAVSEGIEVAMPFVLIGLLLLFKIPIFSKPARLFSILGVDLGDAITGGIAPFWIADVWYLYRSVRKDEAAAEAELAESGQNNMPLYANGRREPASPETAAPLNQDGVRKPNPRANPPVLGNGTNGGKRVNVRV